MKILLIVLLCASLTANALLFVQTSRSHSDSTAVALNQSSRSEGSSALHPAATEGGVSTSQILALLNAQDPAAIQKLRELGFSEKAIRALVNGQVDAQFRERELALRKQGQSNAFWKRRYDFGGWSPETYSAQVDLRRQKDAMLRKLLGADYLPEESRPDPRFADLSPTKAYRVRQLEDDYYAMSTAVRGNGFSSVQFPEDKEKLAYLEKEKRAELSEILTPDELFEYDLRSSSTAMSLRRSLAAFEPTEQEFRDIFKLQQAGETSLGANVNDYSREGQQARRKAQEAVDQQVKALLGDTRFEEYKRANDLDYRRFYQIAARLELPREAAAQAQAVKVSVEERRAKINGDPELRDPGKRAAALESLSQQATVELKQVLGLEGTEAYRQAPGSFLQRLRPPVVRPKG